MEVRSPETFFSKSKVGSEGEDDLAGTCTDLFECVLGFTSVCECYLQSRGRKKMSEESTAWRVPSESFKGHSSVGTVSHLCPSSDLFARLQMSRPPSYPHEIFPMIALALTARP
jgi:hypothetical protein